MVYSRLKIVYLYVIACFASCIKDRAMRRKVVFVALLLTAILLFCFILFLETGSSKTAHAQSFVVSSTLTPTPSGKGGGIDWGNPIIIGALIALIGGLATAGVYIYQTHRNSEIEREKLELEREKLETQHQYEQELEKIRLQHEEDMLLLQKELEAHYKVLERNQQLQDTEAKAAQFSMLRAKTLDERVSAYRKALHADSRIARLQILEMNRPLEVADIYIRLRLHQETRVGYELDSVLLEAPDPNTFIESRVSKALEPEKAISKYKHCVIVGDPGAGKTTMLKYLTLQSVDDRLPNLPDLPVHIELNAFINSGYDDLLAFAASVWDDRYGFPGAEALDYIHTCLQDGKVLLLLDALDETVAGTTQEQAEESYLKTLKAITDLATRYHQIPILVTARKAGYHQRKRLAGFTELEVLDFRPEEIKQFVARWFTSHSDPRRRGDGSELYRKLTRNPRMLALAANPLLLITDSHCV